MEIILQQEEKFKSVARYSATVQPHQRSPASLRLRVIFFVGLDHQDRSIDGQNRNFNDNGIFTKTFDIQMKTLGSDKSFTILAVLH